MDISVVIPCYNGERYVRSCLEALLAQSYPRVRYEVIFVDNGSTDRSAEVARAYSAVAVLGASKRGSYAARNVGVQAASGPVLAFTDSDCEVCPTWLERIDAAMQDPRTKLILGGRRFAAETVLLSTLADYEWEKASYVFSQDDASIYYAYTNNLAVKREAFERAGPFLEVERGGDVIFASKVLSAYGCNAMKFVPEAQIRHLEIDRWLDWPRKMYLYGRSYQNYRGLSRTRALSFASRIEIARRTMRRRHYGLLRSLLLLASGAAVAVGFQLGKTLEWKARGFR